MDKSTTVSKLALYMSWVIAFILVLMPFHAFLSVWAGTAIGHYTAVRIWKEVLLVFLVAGCTHLLIKDKRLFKQFISSRLIQLIIVYCVLSAIWGLGAYGLHKVTTKALGYGVLVNLRFLIFFLVTWVVATKSQWLRQVWPKLILIPAAIVLLVGALQRFILPYDVLKHFGYSQKTIFPYETINHDIHYPRIMSTLRGSNPLGAYLVLIWDIIFAFFLRQKNNRWKWRIFGIATILVLLLSYSRGAWLGLAFSMVVLLWASLKSGKAKRMLEVALLLLIVLGAVSLLIMRNNPTFENVFFHTQTHTSAKVSSNAGHVSALRGGLHDVVHEPLGRGVGTAGPASVYNNKPARIAENYYIQIGQEVGWLGLAIFIAINYFVTQELWRRRKDVLALALFASFLGLIIVNMFSHAWTDDTIAYIWWGLVGIALAPRIAEKTKKA